MLVKLLISVCVCLLSRKSDRCIVLMMRRNALHRTQVKMQPLVDRLLSRIHRWQPNSYRDWILLGPFRYGLLNIQLIAMFFFFINSWSFKFSFVLLMVFTSSGKHPRVVCKCRPLIPRSKLRNGWYTLLKSWTQTNYCLSSASFTCVHAIFFAYHLSVYHISVYLYTPGNIAV